jgi:hypothetical protein
MMTRMRAPSRFSGSAHQADHVLTDKMEYDFKKADTRCRSRLNSFPPPAGHWQRQVLTLA